MNIQINQTTIIAIIGWILAIVGWIVAGRNSDKTIKESKRKTHFDKIKKDLSEILKELSPGGLHYYSMIDDFKFDDLKNHFPELHIKFKNYIELGDQKEKVTEDFFGNLEIKFSKFKLVHNLELYLFHGIYSDNKIAIPSGGVIVSESKEGSTSYKLVNIEGRFFDTSHIQEMQTLQKELEVMRVTDKYKDIVKLLDDIFTLEMDISKTIKMILHTESLPGDCEWMK